MATSYGWIRKRNDKLIATIASRTRMNLIGSINLETMKITVNAYQTLDSKAMEKHFKALRKPKSTKIHLDQGPYNKRNAGGG